jgi:hypothetical protein
MGDRPTESAWEAFGRAVSYAGKAHTDLFVIDKKTHQDRANLFLAQAIASLGSGLQELSTGLRATYILLEQIDRKLPK